MKLAPLTYEISYIDPAKLFTCFSGQPWAMLLDSADYDNLFEDTNRFSYIAVDPFKKILIKNKRDLITDEPVDNPFSFLKKILRPFDVDIMPNFPPFQGGAVGYFSYDLCHYLEEINLPKQCEKHSYADLAIGIYDTVISFDHVEKKAWIISTGFNSNYDLANTEYAQRRIRYFLDKIQSLTDNHMNEYKLTAPISLLSSFTKSSYSELVKKAQDFILEGDIFQVNLSHRFEARLPSTQYDKYQLYLKMRKHNPSPFSAYLNFEDHQILSCSPERFLLVEGKKVSTRPIKGTAGRSTDLQHDKLQAEMLVASEKDRSENVMITDLLRNDLSKVCCPQSVLVKKLCGLESYPTVHHLVSVIEGELQAEVTSLDLLEACFPGGSITGAPKIRAMQIIYELEPTARGPYCGSIGFIGFNGSMDTSIVIRTVLAEQDLISYQAGGAIVLSSTPEAEYEETITKSAAIKKTLIEMELI